VLLTHVCQPQDIDDNDVLFIYTFSKS
jgi:hypothetical protein